MRYLYVFFLLALSFGGQAQNFTHPDNQWIQEGVDLVGGTFANYLSFVGDTVIDNQVYQRMYMNNEYLSDSIPVALVREDSTGVYVRSVNVSVAEEKVYDWTWQAGDSVSLTTNRWYIVDSLSEVSLLDGSTRTAYHITSYRLSPSTPLTYDYTVIHGVGAVDETGFLLSPFYGPGEGDPFFPPDIWAAYIIRLCSFSNAGTALWTFGPNPDCMSPSSTQEGVSQLATPLQVFPNPAQDIVTIQWSPSQDFTHLEIFGLDGRRWQQLHIDSAVGNHQSSLADLPVGLYVFRLSGPKGNASVRVVKQVY